MNSVKILLLVASLLVVLIAGYNLFWNKKLREKHLPNQKNSDYLKKDDPNGQTIYEKKNKILDFFKDKIKNKLELSWQFLYDITDIVLKRFSSEDREAINQVGRILFKAGMRYNHVVDYGINLDKIKIEKEKDKNLQI
jgi:hypothetical protein